ncbi:nucleotide exchange factor GrpE [Phenylobacterium sp. J426]|uniref:nucleotide exchange factor GrpE n=1 Tax=Phenylobacterium sp. J426 TaxID=2898439 RepID=UPI00215197EF|nr:nucleotide exchange factor GrpE [Phenylobacterium sp. J426]MCR5873981.1 nucleotide exchange factor GrpE [Phenylobacterium sp. J426]
MSEDNTPPEDPNDGFDFDGAELEALKAENQGLKDQVLRYAAEAENTKRRAEREANDARAYAIQKFARDLLGVADNLDRAMTAAPTDHPDAPVKNFVVGIEMTAKELLGAFERNGLKKIDPAKGEKFDPHKHQAMMEQPGTDVTPGGVIQVLQPGYELLGRLVRPAMVVVAAKGAGAASSGGGGDGGSNPYAANEDGDQAPGSGGSVDTRA